MFYRAKRALRRRWFNAKGRGVLHTPPLHAGKDGVTLVSMICHGEVLMYLLAAKSFCRQIGYTPHVVILNDGSLDSDDTAILLSHIPGARIVCIREIDTGNCPKGSCWERLLLINDLVATSYVVQLDSDTLTLGPIAEVKEAIDANKSFTLLGDRSFPKIESMIDACNRSRNNLHPQVQAVCERSFDQLPESSSLSYIRGNAGFTGFARNSMNRDEIENYSALMRRLAGKQWDEWGSEQVTSNLIIANTGGASPLPFPKYLSFWAHPEVSYNEAAFIHFIGPHRFSQGLYRRKAGDVIALLSQPAVKG